MELQEHHAGGSSFSGERPGAWQKVHAEPTAQQKEDLSVRAATCQNLKTDTAKVEEATSGRMKEA